jgi:uncharacterized protein
MTYHMRRHDREIQDPKQLIEIIKGGQYAVLALCKDNEPYVVTLSYGYDEAAHALYFHCALQGQKLDFLRANPRASATVIRDLGYQHGHCSHAFASIVIQGEVDMVDTADERQHAIATMIRQLEREPDKVLLKTMKQAATWERTQMIRLRIQHLSGKELLPVADAE